MKIAACFLALALVLDDPIGCDKPAAKPPEQAKHLPPIHRFENVSERSDSPGVALDTVTGQLCRTWDWHYKIAAMSGGLDMLPTCLSIFQSTPTNGDPNDPLGIRKPATTE